MKPIIAANWKMNFTPEESLRLIDDIASQGLPSDVDIIFFPSFISLPAVVDKLLDSAYSVGGQNIFYKEKRDYYNIERLWSDAMITRIKSEDNT